ncbi:MAG: FmdE family protein [Desulfotalea sp.]
MTCTFSANTIEEVISFHGHSCPGLAIGIRAAEYALREMPDVVKNDFVCVTETDMCGIDALQYLTGCTAGKGNLIHRDYGKIAFSFFDRSKNTGFRIFLKDREDYEHHDKNTELMAKKNSGVISAAEQEILSKLREETHHYYMSAPLEELFRKTEVERKPPRPAKILQSLTCDACSEKTMESRTRRFAGETLCIPCFLKVEQKI